MRRTSRLHRQPVLAGILCVPLLMLLSGCEMFQWAHPRQLWKLNRQPALGRDDSYFSIPAEERPDIPEDMDESIPGQHHEATGSTP